MKNKIRENWITIFFLVAMVVVASLPAFRTGVYVGHDLKFHLGRIQAIAEELAQGHFPVRYETNAWYGHGYVSSTFYGNIFLYLPAVLYLAGIPIWRCYNIYVVIVNIATVFISYYCFSRLFKSNNWGLLATGIYALAGYRLSNLYVRSAVGEFTAMAFLPLVVYGVYRIYECGDDDHEGRFKGVIPVVVGASGLIQSHMLTTEMIAMFVFVFAIINIKTTIKVLQKLILSVVLILGVNAFFLVPFLDSYTSMELYINTEISQLSIQGDGLYLKQLFGLLTTGRGESMMWSAENEGYLNVGVVILLCLIMSVIGIVISIKQKDNRNLKYIAILLVFGVLAMCLSTVYFPWDAFAGNSAIDKILTSIQYPWRYVLLETLCFTIAGVYGMKTISEKWFIPVFVVFAGLSVVCAGIFYYTLSYSSLTYTESTAEVDWADKLYLPAATDRGLLENTEITVDGDIVTLPTLAYDTIHVYDADDNELEWTIGDNNCIQVIYEGNFDDLHIAYIEPIWWRISELISACAIIALVIIGVKKIKE